MKALSLALAIPVLAGCQSRGPARPSQHEPVFAPFIDEQGPRLHVVTLPSGKTVKVTSVWTLRFESEAEPPSLSLAYDTEIPFNQTDALRGEVLGIWEYFQTDVAHSGLARAFVFAEQPWGTSPRRTFGVAFRKDAAGSWRATFDARLPCPDVLEYTGRYENRSDEYAFALTIPPGLKGYWNSELYVDDLADGCVCMRDHGRFTLPREPRASRGEPSSGRSIASAFRQTQSATARPVSGTGGCQSPPPRQRPPHRPASDQPLSEDL